MSEPDVNLKCPDGVESSEGFFDPAGYDPNDCAGCGCPKSEHKLEPMVYCHACSKAGGADMPIYHDAPACNDNH